MKIQNIESWANEIEYLLEDIIYVHVYAHAPNDTVTTIIISHTYHHSKLPRETPVPTRLHVHVHAYNMSNLGRCVLLHSACKYLYTHEASIILLAPTETKHQMRF